MSDTIPISELPPIVTPQLTDFFAIVQDGVTYKETVNQLSTLLPNEITGLFVPTLLFGGNAQAMAGTFVGYFVKTGKQVDIQITISLSNKGSSTGSAQIGNLPYSVNNTAGAQKWIPMYLQNCSATGATYTSFAAQGVSGNTVASLYNFPQNNLTAIQLDNTNFNNNSILIVTGTYWTN